MSILQAIIVSIICFFTIHRIENINQKSTPYILAYTYSDNFSNFRSIK